MLKKKKIHENSNGMCGACVGESYNLILDALCEHYGEGSGGRGGCGRWAGQVGGEGLREAGRARRVCNGKIECLCASTCVCVPVQMDAFQFELIKANK